VSFVVHVWLMVNIFLLGDEVNLALVEGEWWAQYANGHFRSACEPLGKDYSGYIPLYRFKKIRKRRSAKEMIHELSARLAHSLHT
jgi:hypothetical protein